MKSVGRTAAAAAETNNKNKFPCYRCDLIYDTMTPDTKALIVICPANPSDYNKEGIIDRELKLVPIDIYAVIFVAASNKLKTDVTDLVKGALHREIRYMGKYH